MTPSAALTPDLCVIGAGSAGLSITAAARAVGLSVVLVERARMGGECLNTGCVPSKALIAAARHAHAVRRAALFGVDAGPPVVDGARVHAHVRAVVDGIAPHDSVARFEGLGVTVIQGEARFLGPDRLTAGGQVVKARRFVVATGSRPAVPPVPGLADAPFLTNESLFDLTALPARLAILGGGAVGVEMAQAFRRLGVAVTLVARHEILPRDDRECVSVVRDRLRREGVAILEATTTAAVETGPDGTVRLRTEGPAGDQTLEADRLLVAAGRVPVVDGLDLQAARVAVTDAGISVTPGLLTSNRRIYAIGDVTGSPRFTHWASHQAGQALTGMLTHWPRKEARQAIVWATYSDPEIAHAGLTEAQARARFGRAEVLRVSYRENDRARTDLEMEGFVKLVVGPRGRVVGASLVGAGAGETVALIALAIAGGLTVSHLSRMILPYPTLAEVVKRAAMTSYTNASKKPLARLVLTALRATL